MKTTSLFSPLRIARKTPKKGKDKSLIHNHQDASRTLLGTAQTLGNRGLSETVILTATLKGRGVSYDLPYTGR